MTWLLFLHNRTMLK